MAGVFPEGAVINTDTEHPVSKESQGNSPNRPDSVDGSPLDDPGVRSPLMKNPTGMDVLSDVPVQDEQQDQESDEP